MVTLYSNVRAVAEGITAGDPAYTSTMYTWEGGSGSTVILGIDGFGAPSNLYRFTLLAFTEGSTNIRTRGDVYAYNKYGSDGYTDRTMGNLDISRSGVLTMTNGGVLLTLANEYKDVYFGGQTMTPASLMVYMNEKYGVHDGYYYDDTIGGNIFEYLGRVTEVTSSTVEYEQCINPLYQYSPDAAIDFTRGEIICSDTIATLQDLNAFLAFGDPLSPTDLQFDVYIDGTKHPNITVQWKTLRQDPSFSLQTTTPIVWCYPLAGGMEQQPLITVDDITVPNDEEWYVEKHAYTWAGEYAKPYLAEFNEITADLNSLEKIVLYGIDGICNAMHYYMRFNYQINAGGQGELIWGDLFDVFVPQRVDDISDIQVRRVEDSKNNPIFGSFIQIHMGQPPEDIDDDNDDYPDGTDADGNPGGVYDPDNPIPDFSSGIPTGFPGQSILTTTYSMGSLTLQNIGTKLWTQSYLDVLKVQSNPIENIVSCKWYPFSITGANASVVIGDIDMGINADKISNIYRFTMGTVTVSKASESFLSCSPFTTIKLHLPYCGIIQLDASELYGRSLTVDYVVDLITGDCLALISLDKSTSKPAGIPYLAISGSCGVDIPLTSTNRVQSEMKAASMTLSAVVGAGGHLMGGDVMGAAAGAASGLANLAGMDFTSQRSGTHSAACQSYNNRYGYIEFSRPAYDPEIYENEGYASRHGFPCHKYTKLQNLCDNAQPKRYYFVKCDARTKIDFAMTAEENRMLEQLLTEGIYIRPIPQQEESQ